MSEQPSPSVCDICGEPDDGRPIIETFDGAAWAHSECLSPPEQAA